MTLIRKLVGLYHFIHGQKVFLELTLPLHGDKTPEATSQLFLSVYSLLSSRSLHERLLGVRNSISLEIHSSKMFGIRYVIYCNEKHTSNIEHLIASYLPEVKIKKLAHSPISNQKSKVFSFRQKAHFAYPLKQFDYLDNHDPIAYITNAMTKLSENESMAYQLVLVPTHSRQADKLLQKIMINDKVMPPTKRERLKVIGWLPRFINTVLFSVTDAFSTAYHGTTENTYRSQNKDLEYKKQVASGIKPVRTLTYFEHEQVEAMSHKLQQPHFRADIRVLVDVSSKKELLSRRKNIESAMGLFSVPNKQRLVVRYVKHYIFQGLEHFSFRKRLPAFITSHSSLFSASEVASLYHFPHSFSAKTENVVKSLSKTLPAPISLKGSNKLDVIIGENIHQGHTTPIGLTSSERERHMYIIGGTGNGKTTMILYQIVQDITAGKGIAVIDPHGDLAEKILHYIPRERIHDVIYMNPDDLAFPIGMNLLELKEGLSGDDLLREKDLITEAAVSVLRKVFSEDDTGGHRIEYVLRNSIQTTLAQTIEEPTLFTIFKLLNDAKFRRSVIKTLEDENLVNFWKNEIGKAGEMQKVKMAAGITAKIGRFLFSASARQVLEQPRSTINFDEILAQNKILICNFSKGLLGDDTSALFGTTVLAKIQTASLRRARIKSDDRTPYYIYVDEFQNFATMGFVQMLSEARKYKVYLTMAEQSTSQQDQQRLVDIILANVGTVVCFRSGSPADERLVLPLFSPFVEQGEIANLPSYSYYVRIAAVQSQEPMSGVTLLLDSEGNEEITQEVIDSSRQRYAKKREKLDTVEHIAKTVKKQKSTSKKETSNQAVKKDFSEFDNAPTTA